MSWNIKQIWTITAVGRSWVYYYWTRLFVPSPLFVSPSLSFMTDILRMRESPWRTLKTAYIAVPKEGATKGRDVALCSAERASEGECHCAARAQVVSLLIWKLWLRKPVCQSDNARRTIHTESQMTMHACSRTPRRRSVPSRAPRLIELD